KVRRMPASKREAKSTAASYDAADYSQLPDEFRPIDPEGIKFRNTATQFWSDYCGEVRRWLRRGNIDQRTREVLSRSIHQCANELSIVAQELMFDERGALP